MEMVEILPFIMLTLKERKVIIKAGKTIYLGA